MASGSVANSSLSCGPGKRTVLMSRNSIDGMGASSAALAAGHTQRFSLSDQLKSRFYRDHEHPYRIFERAIQNSVRPDTILLDIGCGRNAETLRRMIPSVKFAVGVDLVDFAGEIGEYPLNLCQS